MPRDYENRECDDAAPLHRDDTRSQDLQRELIYWNTLGIQFLSDRELDNAKTSRK